MDLSYKIVEKYSPKSKPPDDEFRIMIHKTGQISFNERVSNEWMKGVQKVDLYLLEKDSNKAIGVQPRKDEKGGLSLTKNKNWKSRYISAKGFLTKYGIPFETKRLSPHFDQRSNMIIGEFTDLNRASSMANPAPVMRDLSPVSAEVNPDDRRKQIIDLLKTCGSPLTASQISDRLNITFQLRRKHLKRFKRNISNDLDSLVDQRMVRPVDQIRAVNGKLSNRYSLV